MKFRAAGNKGEITIYEDIGDGFFGGISAKTFAGELKKLGKVSEIVVYINSYGGNVFDGVGIYNQLARHSARVIVDVDGIAASAASVIAMAGDVIRIAENGFMMIHDPWTLAMGGAADLRRTADELERVRDAIADTYVARTKQPRVRIIDQMATETWFSAADALDQGFATEIVGAKQLAAWAPARFPFGRVPNGVVGTTEDERRRREAQRLQLVAERHRRVAEWAHSRPSVAASAAYHPG